MAVLPRSKAEMARLHNYMRLLSNVMDTERMPAREVVDAFANMLILGLIKRRMEAEADALETIDILIDKFKAMRAEPTPTAMTLHLFKNAIHAAED